MTSVDLSNTLAKLEIELAIQFPDILKELNPPASLDQIASFELAVGKNLPEDMRAMYLWRDGCKPRDFDLGLGDDDRQYFLIGQTRWCSLDEMLSRWHFNIEVGFVDTEYSFTEEEDSSSWLSAEIRPWTGIPQAWFPIGRRWWDSWVYVDLLPGTQGHVGQLVQHTTAMGQNVIAQSMAAYLTALLTALEARLVDYDKKLTDGLRLKTIKILIKRGSRLAKHSR